MSKKELAGLIFSGFCGFVIAFLVLVFFGMSWRDAMPASTFIAIVLPVLFYLQNKTKKTNQE